MAIEAPVSMDVVEGQLRSELARALAYVAGFMLRCDVDDLLKGYRYVVENPALTKKDMRSVAYTLCRLSREMMFIDDVERLSVRFRHRLAFLCHACGDLLQKCDDEKVREYVGLLRSRSY